LLREVDHLIDQAQEDPIMNALHRAMFTPLVMLLLAACSAAPATVAPAAQPTVTPTTQPQPTATAQPPAATLTMAAMEMPTAVLAATTASADMSSMDHVGIADPFRVSVAQYFLDAAGFHGMAETLSVTQKIDPSYFGTVTRVTKVLSQTTWPTELNDQAQEFIGSLNAFSAALANDDTKAAIETSDTVHDAQHGLSHAIDVWAAANPTKAAATNPFNVSVAQYFLDSAGFHGMAETLSDTQKIDATYLGKVIRVTKVLSQTTWPTELNDQAQEFIGALNTFSAALAADDSQAAIETSDTVHDAQHELSHAIDGWIATKATLSKEADRFNVSLAQYFLDSAGFHGMAEVLSDTKKIDATYFGTVSRVAKVLKATTWPAELNDQAQAFIKSLNDFATALSDNNVDQAVEASDVVHDAQHELSHAIDAWLGNAHAQ
jgi:hypothetical protein